MTFSTKAVVDAARENWVPVWESVSPVRQATFDLGDGKSVKGIVSGEIALYFCRPDGTVFDILPGLQSPAVTHSAMRDALAFYEATGATEAAIAGRHQDALRGPDALTPNEARSAVLNAKAGLRMRRNDPDPASRDLGEMAFSKVLMIAPAETVTLIEPGGLAIYKSLVHEMLSDGEERTPLGWKTQLFEKILEQPLTGGDVVYDSLTTGPLMFRN